MEPIKVAAVQLFPERRAEDTAGKHLRFLRQAAKAGAALVVFPECSLTGYAADAGVLRPLSASDELIRALEAESDRLGTAVCFGFVERDEPRPHITQELYFRGGRALYRKTHLGTREEAVFAPGDAFPVLAAPRPAGMQLCWETHIPEISAALRRQGAELLLTPYASGMSGEKCRDNWAVQLPARASDNGAFVIACNLLFPPRAGESVPRGGGIAVYDPKGGRLASYFGTEERLLLCDLAGPLPRELPAGDMHAISYFDRVRRELFS